MRILVVDDEPLARRRLVRMLQEIPGVVVDGEAGDAEDALACIREKRPDLVLLDVRMPGLSGLELAATTEDMPLVVFTTAYDQYALEAFEVSAVDYLLKPVEPDRLRVAIEKARSRSGVGDTSQITALLEQLNRRAQKGEPYRLQARSSNTTRFLAAQEITRIFSSGRYAALFHEGREFLLDESLQALEQELSHLGFFRVHRSELVNLSHVRSLRTEAGATRVELSDGQMANVSRRTVVALKQRLGIR